MVGCGCLTQILFASVRMYVLVSCCVFVRSGLGSCFHSALVSTYLKSTLCYTVLYYILCTCLNTDTINDTINVIS